MSKDYLYSMQNLYNPNYEHLSTDEKQQLLIALGKKYGFKLIEFKLFERFELSSYTAVFEKDDAKFVFVPGAEVTLGWEVDIHRCRWSEFKKQEKGLFEKLQNVIDVKFLNKKIDKEISFKDLRKTLEDKSYRLPTFREWEYLSSKGTSTLYSLGDNMEESIQVQHFWKEGEDYRYSLKDPNFFGVVIGKDPYERELTYDDGFFYKGGDGGGFLCGGMGKDLGYLPISSYYEYSKGKLPEERVTRGSFRRVFEIKGW